MKKVVGNLYWDWHGRHTKRLSIAIATYDAHTATVILDKTNSYERIWKGLFRKVSEEPTRTYSAYWGPDSFVGNDVRRLG